MREPSILGSFYFIVIYFNFLIPKLLQGKAKTKLSTLHY